MSKVSEIGCYGAIVGLAMALSLSSAFADQYAEQASMSKDIHDKAAAFIEKVGAEEAIKAFNAPDTEWYAGPEKMHQMVALIVNDPDDMLFLSQTGFPNAVGLRQSDIADMDGKPVDSVMYGALNKSPKGARFAVPFPLPGTNTPAHSEAYCSFVDNDTKILCGWTQQAEK